MCSSPCKSIVVQLPRIVSSSFCGLGAQEADIFHVGNPPADYRKDKERHYLCGICTSRLWTLLMFGWTSVEYCLCCLEHLLCQRNISCASIQQWLRCTAGNVRRGESFCLLLDVEMFEHTYNPAFYDAGGAACSTRGQSFGCMGAAPHNFDEADNRVRHHAKCRCPLVMPFLLLANSCSC